MQPPRAMRARLLGRLPEARFVHQPQYRLGQSVSRQAAQLQQYRIAVRFGFGRVHIVIAEHRHRDHRHSVIHTLEHAQQAAVRDECAQLAMTCNAHGEKTSHQHARKEHTQIPMCSPRTSCCGSQRLSRTFGGKSCMSD